MSCDISTSHILRRRWHVTGQVQGVGFRPFVYRLAAELQLDGSVRNDPSGVTIEACGPAGRLDELQRRVKRDAPALARITAVRLIDEEPAETRRGCFRIIQSEREGTDRGRVTVDSAVCDDCLRELFDAADRRHRHALINCTNCGPRYTIVRDLPYDRPLTTMADFAMCDACACEYADPADRRFHAQPTCCPQCGPQLRVLDRRGAGLTGDPIACAAALLRAGQILAMKGLGGYHLVVDALDEAAVRRLRQRKRRDYKPFAVMVNDLQTASHYVRLSREAQALLDSPICPIVLADRAGENADDVNPIVESVTVGCHRLGVMLPYTPMQHLLFAEGLGPLVMTSANESDDPLIKDDDEALARLGRMCDAFLLHDRPIERAVDDSIVIDAPRGISPIRRARGYVPAPLAVPVPAPQPGLCVGGELKNAVAVVRGDSAILSQHIGDLTYTLAYRRFERTIDDLKRLFDVDVRWIACDAHPRYMSRRYAKRAAAGAGLELITTQHHHAHFASLLAEHDRTDRCIGLICDGVGYGDDGTAWGGEILVGDLVTYQRLGRLRPLRLPGGDAAARQIGRCALSWLMDALGPDAAEHALAKRAIPDDRQRQGLASLLQSDLNCPPSSGMGRLFDAAASLLGLADYNHYEAMSGLMLEAAAHAATSRPPGEGVIAVVSADRPTGLLELDHRPLLTGLIELMGRGGSPEALAWFFHDALADGMARAVRLVADRLDIRTVALSGGVFCNALLTDLAAQRLEAWGLEVLLHREVPANDGGLAFGQAAIAAATLAAGKS
jgi:hydrogenase maturation protein HypF